MAVAVVGTKATKVIKMEPEQQDEDVPDVSHSSLQPLASSSSPPQNDEHPADELARLQRESTAMLKLLQRLNAQEQDLRSKNIMLAREALIAGMDVDKLDMPPQRQGKKVIRPRRKEPWYVLELGKLGKRSVVNKKENSNESKNADHTAMPGDTSLPE